MLVHASVRPDRITPREISQIYKTRLPPQHEIDMGGVVGITEIVDCVTTHSSNWFQGPYGFVLRNSRALPFVPWKGQLGLRDAPAELLRKLKL